MFRSIVIATDLSDTSQAALSAGLRLAREQGARVAIVHTLELWFVHRQWLAPISDDERRRFDDIVRGEEQAVRERIVRDVAEALGGDAGQEEVTAIVRDGRAAEVITTVAAEHDADLIVIGTRGRPETLGSVAEQLVRIARRQVLVVPRGAGA